MDEPWPKCWSCEIEGGSLQPSVTESKDPQAVNLKKVKGQTCFRPEVGSW